MQATQASSGTRFSASAAGASFSGIQLLPGDVLLSCGTEALSILIKRLDGGDYSHSAVWDGAGAVDATGHGFERRDLQKDIDEQWYIDAYRWHSPPPSPLDLGSEPYPSRPLITRSDRIVDAKTQFAYDELLMAALVIAVSKQPDDEWMRRAVRVLLSRAQQWVHDHITTKPGTTAMTCAESVAVSFDEAVPPKYAIRINIDQSRNYDIIATAGPGLRAGLITNAFSSYNDVQRRYAEVVAAAAPATPHAMQTALGAKRDVRMILPPGCVTPRDLQTSPSLRKLGRLSENPMPPAASAPSWRLFLDLIREYLLHRPKTLSRR